MLTQTSPVTSPLVTFLASSWVFCVCQFESYAWPSPGNGATPALRERDTGEMIKRSDEECSSTEDCQTFGSHAVCSNSRCGCEEGYHLLYDLNGTRCIEDIMSGATEEPRIYMDENMIPIIVVLAIMFVGMCVALHLFSRARFRNHRTIFNSPHPRLMHIKLGKRGKRRRASRASLQVPGSPHPSLVSSSPRPSRAGLHSSHESLRSPPPKRTEPPPEGQKSETHSLASNDGQSKQNTTGVEGKRESVCNGPASSPTVIVNNRGSPPPQKNKSPSPPTRV